MAEISVAKWGSLHRKMEERLAAKGFSDETARFEWVCLIDDFTGSAYSSIRQEADGSWDGKVGKFVNDNEQRPEHKLADGACIDILVNNGAIADWGALHGSTLGQWERMFDINVSSMYLLCRDLSKGCLLYTSDAADE